MDKETLFGYLDLSGGQDSWFDLWHTHADWDGDGNKDWQTRKKFIDELVNFYNDLKVKMKNYPRDFQLYIWILEGDSSQDAVYLHSKNPNQDNFPIKIETVDNFVVNDKFLKSYIDGLGLKVIADTYDNELQYYLFDSNVGTPLTK